MVMELRANSLMKQNDELLLDNNRNCLSVDYITTLFQFRNYILALHTKTRKKSG